MTVQTQLPDQKTLQNSYRGVLRVQIQSRPSGQGTEKDAGTSMNLLIQMAAQMVETVQEIEGARTKGLAKVLSTGTTLSPRLDPEKLLELSHQQEGYSQEERAKLDKAAAQLRADWQQARDRFHEDFWSVIKRLRDRCYALSQSNMADHIMSTYTRKRGELDRLIAWSQGTLSPLIAGVKEQIAAIDAAMAEELNKNLFDYALSLMPSQSTVSALGMPLTKGTLTAGTAGIQTDTARQPAQSGTAPSAAQSGGTAQTPGQGEAGTSGGAGQTPQTQAAKNTAETAPAAYQLPYIFIQAPAQAGETGGSGAAESLSTATPEAIAIKAAYESLQSTLKLLSGSVKLYQQIGEREDLRNKLDELEKKYQEAMDDYQALAFDLDDLDQLSKLLEQAALYLREVEKLDVTLNAFSRALSAAGENPPAYYEVFSQLGDYLKSLQLIWR